MWSYKQVEVYFAIHVSTTYAIILDRIVEPVLYVFKALDTDRTA